MQPSAVSSGYLIPKLQECPSEYAFNTDKPVLRTPVQTFSEYQFIELNPWKAAIPNNGYHYVQANEVPPRVNTNQNYGNPISLAQLKERLNHMESGYYRPTIVDGNLYFVASESLNTTARSFPSDSEKTAVEHENVNSEIKTAKESMSITNLKTGRFPQSPNVKKALSDIKLSMSQLRKLLGRELFREVIRKYKREHGLHSEEKLEGSTAHEASLRSTLTAIENETSSKDVDTAKSFGVLDSQYSTRTALDYDMTSSKDVETAKSFGILDSAYSTMTAIEPNFNSTKTAEENVTSSKDVETAKSFGDLNTQYSTRTAIENVTSSKDVDTAVSYHDSTVTAVENLTSSKDVDTALSFKSQTSLRTGVENEAVTSSNDVQTAKSFVFSLKTGVENDAVSSSKNVQTAQSFKSQANLNTAVGNETLRSSKDVQTAKSFTTQASVKTGVENEALTSSKDVQTAKSFKSQANLNTAVENQTLKSSIDVQTAKSFTNQGSVKTGVENETVTSSKDVQTAKSFTTQASVKTGVENEAVTSSKGVNTAKLVEENNNKQEESSVSTESYGSSTTSRSTSATSTRSNVASDLSSELNTMVAAAEKHLGDEKIEKLEPDVHRSVTEMMNSTNLGQTPNVFDNRAVNAAKGVDVIGSLAEQLPTALDAGTRTAIELSERASEVSVVTAIEN